jgi:hypothetical protein
MGISEKGRLNELAIGAMHYLIGTVFVLVATLVVIAFI